MYKDNYYKKYDQSRKVNLQPTIIKYSIQKIIDLILEKNISMHCKDKMSSSPKECTS